MSVLGYEIDTEAPDEKTGKRETKFGPTTYAEYVSNICESFGCLPDEAERQDPQLVRHILQVRNARYAVKLMNTDGAEFAKHPELGELLKRLVDAMNEAAD